MSKNRNRPTARLDPKERLDVASWQKLSSTDFVITITKEGKKYRDWSAWWRDAETADVVSDHVLFELQRLFKLIEWGKLNELETKS